MAAGKVIRARSAQAFAGGKSAHVAMVLRTLGNTPGFCGGKTGEELASRLSRPGIETHPSQTAGQTRTNLEIIDDRGIVTEILEPGEAQTDDEVARFEETRSKLFREGKEQLCVVFFWQFAARHFFGFLLAIDFDGEEFRLSDLSRRRRRASWDYPARAARFHKADTSTRPVRIWEFRSTLA